MKRKMETFKKAQKALEPLGIKPTAYGLRKALNQRGIDISINGVSNYIKQPCKSIRPRCSDLPSGTMRRSWRIFNNLLGMV
jgi:hypothetical protein